MLLDMNILTFDTEEWYIEREFKGGRKEKYKQYDEVLEWILSTLQTYDLKATFFCVGKLADYFPEVVKKISDCGHEIGCHSNEHKWVTKMTMQEFSCDTERAVKSLEDRVGRKVRSYRAPAFSIGQDNLWAFDILVENGIEYDCSVFPLNRDFGGFPQFTSSVPSLLKRDKYVLKEFPICPGQMFGKAVSFSGGGYFRIMPLCVQRYMMKHMDYAMFYFHIHDLIKQKSGFMSSKEYEEYFKEPGTLKNRLSRYIKSNVGKGNSIIKLNKLIEIKNFISVEQAGASIDWQCQPIVNL